MKQKPMPFDLADILDSEDAIEAYLMQSMKNGGTAELARARLKLEKARAHNLRVDPLMARAVPPPPISYPAPAVHGGPTLSGPVVDKPTIRRCCG